MDPRTRLVIGVLFALVIGLLVGLIIVAGDNSSDDNGTTVTVRPTTRSTQSTTRPAPTTPTVTNGGVSVPGGTGGSSPGGSGGLGQ